MTLTYVKAVINRAKARFEGLDFIVIDYFQLYRTPTGSGSGSREQDLAIFSQGLLTACRDADTALIIVAQLNRDNEKTGREPKLTDIRECGQLEQDAHRVILGSRKEDNQREVIWNYAKNRNGPIGKFETKFEPWCTRFIHERTL